MIPCPECGQTWVDERSLAVHRAKPHHQCPICPKSYIRVERHMALSHQPAERVDLASHYRRLWIRLNVLHEEHSTNPITVCQAEPCVQFEDLISAFPSWRLRGLALRRAKDCAVLTAPAKP